MLITEGSKACLKVVLLIHKIYELSNGLRLTTNVYNSVYVRNHLNQVQGAFLSQEVMLKGFKKVKLTNFHVNVQFCYCANEGV